MKTHKNHKPPRHPATNSVVFPGIHSPVGWAEPKAMPNIGMHHQGWQSPDRRVFRLCDSSECWASPPAQPNLRLCEAGEGRGGGKRRIAKAPSFRAKSRNPNSVCSEVKLMDSATSRGMTQLSPVGWAEPQAMPNVGMHHQGWQSPDCRVFRLCDSSECWASPSAQPNLRLCEAGEGRGGGTRRIAKAPSFPRRRESSGPWLSPEGGRPAWIPAFAGMTKEPRRAGSPRRITPSPSGREEKNRRTYHISSTSASFFFEVTTSKPTVPAKRADSLRLCELLLAS